MEGREPRIRSKRKGEDRTKISASSGSGLLFFSHSLSNRKLATGRRKMGIIMRGRGGGERAGGRDLLEKEIWHGTGLAFAL